MSSREYNVNQGAYIWRNSAGQWHRDDGPAAEYDNGNKHWFQNDKLHREDGPAVEFPDGTKFWYQNDKRHRDDGPAMEWPCGYKEWYINGNKLTEKQFNNRDAAPKTIAINGITYNLTRV